MGRFTHMPRADVVEFLEANGFAVYDTEPIDALREAAFLHEEGEGDIAALAVASSLILVPVWGGDSDG